MLIPNIDRYLVSVYVESVLKVFKYFNPLGIWSLVSLRIMQNVYKKCKMCYAERFMRVCILMFLFLYLKLLHVQNLLRALHFSIKLCVLFSPVLLMPFYFVYSIFSEYL